MTRPASGPSPSGRRRRRTVRRRRAGGAERRDLVVLVAGHSQHLRLAQRPDPQGLDKPVHPRRGSAGRVAGRDPSDHGGLGALAPLEKRLREVIPVRCLGIATSIEPTRASRSRRRYPSRRFGRPVRRAHRAADGVTRRGGQADDESHHGVIDTTCNRCPVVCPEVRAPANRVH